MRSREPEYGLMAYDRCLTAFCGTMVAPPDFRKYLKVYQGRRYMAGFQEQNGRFPQGIEDAVYYADEPARYIP